MNFDDWIEAGYAMGWIRKTTCVTHQELDTRPASNECQYLMELNMDARTEVPTYLYECNTCEQKTSVTRSVTDSEKAPACIACGKDMGRVYGLAAVKFNGRGYYSTDKGK